MNLLLKTRVSLDMTSAALLRRMLAFVAVDVLFLSFATAHLFEYGGILAAMLYLAAQYTVSTAGYLSGFYVMRLCGTSAQASVRAGLALLSLCLLGASQATTGVAIAFLVLAGLGRGVAWAGRQWLELHKTEGASREQYLALLTGLSTLVKIVLPSIAATVAYFDSDTIQPILIFGGVVGILGVLVWKPTSVLRCPPVGPLHPISTLASPAYRNNAGFFLLDAGGASLRQALFVSGTMAVLGSLSAFGIVESSAALLSALVLALLATRPTSSPSIGLLKGSMALMALAWLCLLLTTWHPWMLALFVGLYALSQPLLQTVKSSLVLKGLMAPGIAPQNSAIARELLQLAARVSALLAGAVLTTLPEFEYGALILSVILLLIMMPFEFSRARTIAHQKAR